MLQIVVPHLQILPAFRACQLLLFLPALPQRRKVLAAKYSSTLRQVLERFPQSTLAVFAHPFLPFCLSPVFARPCRRRLAGMRFYGVLYPVLHKYAV